ncbi:ABC transporter permease [Chryseobacterium sp. MFBS3-17]|uniref:ABC transporter permease n=1 Tax=Chryseobacterium sp. MFBS3-17 TaxID=2886689 RepID=UPI001D0E531E|nr:iron chelate uptake ABC transporter family permease subunit [Chryseobacterium sp. MFBS3-17]MCC2589943.1 iron chelate uptake ABC transporter family permease subunit [Chryseobacterium sp. MFBS3-17]
MKYILLTVLMLFCAVVSLFVGVQDISFSDFLNLTDDQRMTLGISRIPRTVSLIMVGMGMSIAGFIMQQISQNKFVSPSTAGTLDAAKLGILVALINFPLATTLQKSFIALVITLVTTVFFIVMVRRIRFRNVIFIPLIGMMFGNILNAVATFYAYKNNIVQNMQGWLMGDFSAVLQGNYESVYFILPAVILSYVYANEFVVVGMGENFSKNLGLSYHQIVMIGLFCVALTVSVSVVTVGAVPFLGLIIPNLVSMIHGDQLKKTLPYTALYGAIFLLICDIIGRIIIYPYEIPIGLTIGVIGGIFFLILILKRSR